jgi:hypothetical protein
MTLTPYPIPHSFRNRAFQVDLSWQPLVFGWQPSV